VIDPTERLISSLGDALEPVRPLPRLRTVFALVLIVSTALVGLVALTGAGRIATRAFSESGLYVACWVALIVAGCAGTISALAAGIPGRERLGEIAMGLAVLGLVAGAATCGLAIGMQPLSSPPGLDAECFTSGTILAVFPAGVILGFLLRGLIASPLRAALIALLAAGALGGMIVHLHCGFVGPQHLLLGHLSVPLVWALVGLGLYPLVVLMRRARNGSDG
jgi:hypothetical protein